VVLALLGTLTIIGALFWGEKHTGNFRATLTWSTIALYLVLSLRLRRGDVWGSLKLTAIYAAVQVVYGLLVLGLQAIVKVSMPESAPDSDLVPWALFLGFLKTVAPVVPLLFLWSHLSPRAAKKNAPI
jgi:hypothetical protein